MLNIVALNHEGKYTEYEWNSMEEFVSGMNNDKENIPSLDDVLINVETDNENLHLWWKNADGLSVADLYEECKRELWNDDYCFHTFINASKELFGIEDENVKYVSISLVYPTAPTKSGEVCVSYLPIFYNKTSGGYDEWTEAFLSCDEVNKLVEADEFSQKCIKRIEIAKKKNAMGNFFEKGNVLDVIVTGFGSGLAEVVDVDKENNTVALWWGVFSPRYETQLYSEEMYTVPQTYNISDIFAVKFSDLSKLEPARKAQLRNDEEIFARYREIAGRI